MRVLSPMYQVLVAVSRSKDVILEFLSEPILRPIAHFSKEIFVVLKRITLVSTSHLFSRCSRISWVLTRTTRWSEKALALPLQLIASLWRSWFASPIDKYKTVEEEARYWKDAAQWQRVLQQTDARHVGRTLTVRKAVAKPREQITPPPLVTYYTPALLPAYRDMPQRWKHRACGAPHNVTRRNGTKRIRTGNVSQKTRVEQIALSAKDYVKWHWMVFPGLHGSDHPSMREAQFLKSTHSPEEQKVIYHIAHMLKDYKVFPAEGHGSHKWTPKYKDIWLRWLHSPERKEAEQRAKECSDSRRRKPLSNSP